MDLTLVYSYYRNYEMFKQQLAEWQKYPAEILDNVEFIITDDCSPKARLQETVSFIPKEIKNIRLFQITKKVPWNWLACRNIGCHYAKGKWILMTDMDHMVSSESIQKIMKVLPTLNENGAYLFTREDALTFKPYKPHDDSYLMTKKMFWKIGGYDEELSGLYGTAGRYRMLRVAKNAGELIRLPIPLTRWGREVLVDASTTDFPRKLPKAYHKTLVQERVNLKERQGRAQEVLVLSFPYEEIRF